MNKTAHTDMKQKPLSVNHLVLNGMHQPMLQSPPLQKQRLTVSLPAPLMERLRNVVYWTKDRPLVGLVAEAIEDIVTQMEEINGGAFPQRVSPLKPGRRQGKRSPIPVRKTPFERRGVAGLVHLVSLVQATIQDKPN
jgi:hypothetical protein